MKNLVSILCTSLLTMCISMIHAQDSTPVIIDKVIAKVGGEYILYSDVVEAFKYQKERNPLMSEEDICPLMEQIIAQKVLVNQAKLDSVQVSSEELDNQLDYRIDNILGMMGGDEEKFVDYYGKSIVEVKDQMRGDLRQQMLAERIQQRLINEVTITPKEVVEFYNQIPKDSLPLLSSEVEIAEIIVAPKVNKEENQKAREKLIDIKSKIEEGATFEEMAQRFSSDGSSETGGNLGWQKRGTFVPEFEAAAYSLEKSQMSDLVETEFGFHLIRLNDRRGNLINCSHILIRPAITAADLDLAKGKLDSIKNIIVTDSLRFDRAVKLYSDKNSQSYNNNGRMSNPKNGTTFFETGDLPTEIYFEIENMEIGEISDPIEFYSPSGEPYFRIAKLVSRTKPHIASLDQDYSKIQQYARESKRNVYYNNWIVEKMDNTFIEVNESFGRCDNIKRWAKKEDK